MRRTCGPITHRAAHLREGSGGQGRRPAGRAPSRRRSRQTTLFPACRQPKIHLPLAWWVEPGSILDAPHEIDIAMTCNLTFILRVIYCVNWTIKVLCVPVEVAGGRMTQEFSDKDRDDLEGGDRLSRLSVASLSMNQGQDFDTVVQEVVDGARSLTGPRYGVLTTLDGKGSPLDSVTSGLTGEERRGTVGIGGLPARGAAGLPAPRRPGKIVAVPRLPRQYRPLDTNGGEIACPLTRVSDTATPGSSPTSPARGHQHVGVGRSPPRGFWAAPAGEAAEAEAVGNAETGVRLASPHHFYGNSLRGPAG